MGVGVGLMKTEEGEAVLVVVGIVIVEVEGRRMTMTEEVDQGGGGLEGLDGVMACLMGLDQEPWVWTCEI